MNHLLMKSNFSEDERLSGSCWAPHGQQGCRTVPAQHPELSLVLQMVLLCSHCHLYQDSRAESWQFYLQCGKPRSGGAEMSLSIRIYTRVFYYIYSQTQKKFNTVKQTVRYLQHGTGDWFLHSEDGQCFSFTRRQQMQQTANCHPLLLNICRKAN